ncbi:hypothetical protein Scep_011096 [Stephania cephalantha]|uniref:HTH La-type RNA-binding domain-containing protein n=1 Tax=Stephania cephalantha TaxID=152367 RepID=A0AAP0PHN7_9MAGN
MAAQEELETLEPPPSVDQIGAGDRTASDPSDPSLSRNISSSRLNAGAPEFVPRSSSSSSNRSDLQQATATPIHVFPVQPPPFCIPYQNYGTFPEHEIVVVSPPPSQLPSEVVDHAPPAPNGLPDEVCNKIVNQVGAEAPASAQGSEEAVFDCLVGVEAPSGVPWRHVPISVVASFKKIKALVSTPPQLAKVLRKSSKLVVSDDGKKVRRLHTLTESDIEDLQSRIVVAENLPDDHSYQNLMRIFSVVGSVKTIRTCQPQNLNAGPSASATSRSSKVERKLESALFSNKLHAFVEYETVELAEKAIAELNDEGNWRSGLRVFNCSSNLTEIDRSGNGIVANFVSPVSIGLVQSKSAHTRSRKVGNEGEGKFDMDDISTSEQTIEKHPEDHEPSDLFNEHTVEDTYLHEKEGGSRRSRGRGRGKGRGRGQHHNHRGNHHIGTPPSNSSIQNEQSVAVKPPPGPRMPDGTRGFAIGRGRPIVAGDAA